MVVSGRGSINCLAAEEMLGLTAPRMGNVQVALEFHGPLLCFVFLRKAGSEQSDKKQGRVRKGSLPERLITSFSGSAYL